MRLNAASISLTGHFVTTNLYTNIVDLSGSYQYVVRLISLTL